MQEITCKGNSRSCKILKQLFPELFRAAWLLPEQSSWNNTTIYWAPVNTANIDVRRRKCVQLPDTASLYIPEHAW